MNENTASRVALSGYTDNIGTEAYNMGLSNRRWMSVRDYVVKHGVSSSRVSGQGFGESKPIASNATAEGRAKNRRVEIKVN
jgi:OOP family OmpA-OmpF porin